MLQFTVDAHDTGLGVGGACNTCCCTAFGMRPGEVNLLRINYAPWSVPFGGIGLTGQPDITIETDSSACSTQPIDGQPDPSTSNGNYGPGYLTVASGNTLNLNMADGVFPVGTAVKFELVPVGGPYIGVLNPTPADGSLWQYHAPPGANGFDQFWVRITDHQGRVLIRSVNILVGSTAGLVIPFGRSALDYGLIVDRPKIVVNPRMHVVDIPIKLQPNGACDTIEGCRKYRMTIKQRATDCDNVFDRIDCFDVRCRKC